MKTVFVLFRLWWKRLLQNFFLSYCFSTLFIRYFFTYLCLLFENKQIVNMKINCLNWTKELRGIGILHIRYYWIWLFLSYWNPSDPNISMFLRLSDPTVGHHWIRHPTTSYWIPVPRNPTTSDSFLLEVIGFLSESIGLYKETVSDPVRSYFQILRPRLTF